MEMEFLAHSDTLALTVTGFTYSMHRLLWTLLQATRRPFQRHRFHAVRTRLEEFLLNKRYESAFTFTTTVLAPLVLEAPSFSIYQQVDLLRNLTVHDFEAFLATAQKEPTHLDCLGFGDFTPWHVTAMARDVAAEFQTERTDALRFHDTLLLPPGGEAVVQVPAPNPDDINSVLLNVYQYPVNTSIKDALAMDLLEYVTEVPVYATLRTKEQLGYTVSATMVQQHPPGFNLSSYRVLVQSGDYGPEYLDSRVEAFFAGAHSLIEGLTDAAVEDAKQRLLARKRPQPLSLHDEFAVRWAEIAQHTFKFSRQASRVKALVSLTRADLLRVLRVAILDPQRRRKISIRVYGKGHPIPPVNKSQTAVSLQTLRGWQATLPHLHGVLEA